MGRMGHSRAVVVTVVEEEMTAVLAEFGTDHEVRGSGCWAKGPAQNSVYPLLVAQSSDRSNMPYGETVRYLIEDWKPEVVFLVGIAGGIARLDSDGLVGPQAGDVVCVEYVHYGAYTKRVNGRRLLRYFPMEHPAAEVIRRHVRPIARTEWFDRLPVARPGDDRGIPELHFGEIVSVEFLAGDVGVDEQRALFGQYDHALAVDMESAGIARAMHSARHGVHYGPIWLGLRGISDRTAATTEAASALNAENDIERKQWRDYAAAAAARVAVRCVERILAEPRPPEPEDPGAPAWTA
ncbi:MAG TPA: hypothetical protein VJ851_09195 [Jatrophihabitans sp.]|nr:hypothetical protein [Jatrophihabitans sp.]